MSVNAIASVFAGYAQQITGSSGGTATTSTQAAVQEATETPQQTAKEARNGDRVAVRKLQHLQQQQQQAGATESAPASEPGKGEQVDAKA